MDVILEQIMKDTILILSVKNLITLYIVIMGNVISLPRIMVTSLMNWTLPGNVSHLNVHYWHYKIHVIQIIMEFHIMMK